MTTIFQFFNNAYHPKPRQGRLTDWRSHLISALAAVCLLLALEIGRASCRERVYSSV